MRARLAITALAGLLLMAVVPPAARADGDAEAQIRIRVIHATQGRKNFDSKLRDLKRYLDIYQYSSYQQVIDETLTLKPGEAKGVGLLRGKNLNTELVSLSREKATLRLRLFGQAGVMLNTKVNVGRDSLFFIAGPRYQGGVLFISVSAHYDVADLEEEARVVEKKKNE